MKPEEYKSTNLLKRGVEFSSQCPLVKAKIVRSISFLICLNSKEKWVEFHKDIQPNSELWDEKKLKEKGIL